MLPYHRCSLVTSEVYFFVQVRLGFLRQSALARGERSYSWKEP